MWLLKLAIAVLATLGSPLSSYAQTLVIHVEGLRDTVGSIRFGFYDSASQWETKKSTFQRHVRKGRLVRGGRASYTFTDVRPGRYGVAMVDDENESGGMDWGVVLPREGFGFSDCEVRGVRRPNFDEFDFELRAGQRTEVVVRVRYL